ncbi:MAG: DUF742 domain-containing protein [Angustibacter sp.]
MTALQHGVADGDMSGLSASDSGSDYDPMIRPFVLTGGRTSSNVPVEALVTASSDSLARPVRLSSEQQAILDLCHTPVAVAEVAARLSLPLSVTRILVSDLESYGVLYLSPVAGGDADLDLIGRLLDGIHRL